MFQIKHKLGAVKFELKYFFLSNKIKLFAIYINLKLAKIFQIEILNACEVSISIFKALFSFQMV